jgi:hypothetical protein
MSPFASADSHTDFESGADPAHASGDPSTERPDADRPRETNASGNRADGAGCHAPNAGDPADAACEAEEEIEITPEMIDAGERVLMGYETYFTSERYWAREVYLAMHAEAPEHSR